MTSALGLSVVDFLRQKSSRLHTDSVADTLSSTGNLSGVTAKFNPFIRASLSVSLTDLSDRLITHLSVLTLLSVLVELDTLDLITRLSNFLR